MKETEQKNKLDWQRKEIMQRRKVYMLVLRRNSHSRDPTILCDISSAKSYFLT